MTALIVKRFLQMLKNTPLTITLTQSILKIAMSHGDILQRKTCLYKSITEIIGLGIIGTGTIGILTEIEITGDMDGDLAMDFTETMFISLITMGIIETIYITVFFILHITMYQTTETAGMLDTTITDLRETTSMDNETLTIEEAMHRLVRGQIDTLKEMQLQ